MCLALRNADQNKVYDTKEKNEIKKKKKNLNHSCRCVLTKQEESGCLMSKNFLKFCLLRFGIWFLTFHVLFVVSDEPTPFQK